jgi:hypothetical protein
MIKTSRTIGGTMRGLAPALISLATVIAAILVVAPAADAATYPVKPFHIDNGNTYTTGTVTFYSRSVLVAGEQKSVSVDSCRSTTGTSYDNHTFTDVGHSQHTCGRSEKFSFSLNADVPGGAAYVLVSFTAWAPPGATTGKTLGSVRVNRS